MPTLAIQSPLDQPENRSRLIDDLRDGLNDSGFTALKIIVAYGKEAPLRKLRQEIEAWRDAGKRAEIIYGIDHQGTSLEVLRLSRELFDTVRIFHQNGMAHTFHPKLYLFQGDDRGMAYVGSNNLTTGGTETNFECGVKISLQSPQDDALIEKFQETWNETSERTLELDDDLLEELQEANLVVSEEVTRARANGEFREDNEDREHPDFPQTDVQPASPTPGEEGAQPEEGAPTETTPLERIESDSSLEWRKRNLKARDAQRPGDNTNPSGVITLVQDYFRDDTGQRIDKTTYFRYDVFGDLEWWEEDDKEVAEAKFRIWIDEYFRRVYTLRISHKLEWEADQDNYTTAIHWGPLNHILREEIDIRGWNFYLYETDEDGQWEIQLVSPENVED